jgi:putative nucleotidyltransferase with HDIG domain
LTTTFAALPRNAQTFLGAVAVCGLFVIAHSVHALYSAPVPPQWLLLAALTLLSGSITIRLPSIPITISVSETFVFTAALLYGTAAGTITVTLDGLIISLWLQRRNLEFYKLLFNTTAPAVSIWLSAQLFFLITHAEPLIARSTPISALLPGLLVFAVAYFLLNSWLMAVAVSLEGASNPRTVWRQNFLWLSLNVFSGASVAVLLVSLNPQMNLSALAVIVPLLAVSYLTYHTSLGRVEDANQHVSNLNRLYLSTIETLALAIDAKDQITHGHIRRVQAYSVRLARQIGICDKKLIMAIEAASLLHDMGKLAIPEHILNKPGKLTAEEFDIMKFHSSVGAEILAAVEFPYPVVPIVRHHHENWDGTGYPDELSGTDIPLGARILSVVDCFDALTSDRPYRDRLSDTEAIEILQSRRGTMYDPLIVDAFLLMHETFDLPSDSLPQDAIALNTRLRLRDKIEPIPSERIGNQEWMHRVYRRLPYAIEVVGSYLARIIPGSMVILYNVDHANTVLRVFRIWGQNVDTGTTLTLPLQNSLSGRAVAANQQIDGDASLDLVFGNAADIGQYGEASTVALSDRGQFVAVLTVYFPSSSERLTTPRPNLGVVRDHLTTLLPWRSSE